MEILRRRQHARHLFPVLGIVAGLVLIAVPFKTSLDNDAWGDRLRTEGVQVQAVVFETEYGPRNSRTMHLGYDVADVRHRAEVACRQVCHPAGTAVRIWVSPHDPGDFVTDFGVLSGHRGRLQGGIGMAGLVLFVAMVILVGSRLADRRRERRRQRWKADERDQRRQQSKPVTLRRRKG
ncbi:DUF3592 domain-containing protein [Actinoplanes sp. CA-252034]|uniref:DUF3592 domain-containing protein n=1 Tax=Actinoplanes sp. CA-252034 TaxID=3239906 RepID=UPI003D99545D